MVKRILVRKKDDFDRESKNYLKTLKETYHMPLEGLKLIKCYDIEGIDSDEDLALIVSTVLSEPNADVVETFDFIDSEKIFRFQPLPGQFDQRADSAMQCAEIVTLKARPTIVASKIIALKGELTLEQIKTIKDFFINPVESHEVTLAIPEKIRLAFDKPSPIKIIDGFINWNEKMLDAFRIKMAFAMTHRDITFVQLYFKETEKRNPTITELVVIDTYWSDHCRHTTFLTELSSVDISQGAYAKPILESYKDYCQMRKTMNYDQKRPMTLMDMATINAKILRQAGKVPNLDISDEINACSIEIEVDEGGETKPWLLMFKNETHNHPTEIEPFGGAATCLGGAIRDPLSGRSYVYQSMRISGSGDPTASIESTLDGKLPQQYISHQAAAGFSAYGNQIGLATGYVREIYHPGYVAKRMEVGAVIGAAPKENVVRENPVSGDVVVLVGGRTGRDGIGGATGSSKEHDEQSLVDCGSQVQKGNPPEERKIQRLFRNPKASKLIKRCNDFGAGGVAVAVGELADSLDINLDAVKKKYEGLDGTEIAISESQERMAVVLSKENLFVFSDLCHKENLEVTEIAEVTGSGRLKMSWNNTCILNLSRAFLDTNGIQGQANIIVKCPDSMSYFNKELGKKVSEVSWTENLKDLNHCSQKGLVERFDSTIGSGSVLMPFGGRNQRSPIQTMVAKIPVFMKETTTVSMMAYGFDPELSSWSPYHGGVYAVLDSVAKIVATGGDYRDIYLSFQEYFEKLGEDASKWGKPFSAILGASKVQSMFEIAAIGGKDSMSGTFKDLDVPPTLISFAVCTSEADKIISPELKSTNSKLILLYSKRDKAEMPDFESLKRRYQTLTTLVHDQSVLSAYAIGSGGVGRAISEMAFGNNIGVKINEETSIDWFEPSYGSILIEVAATQVDRVSELIDGIVIGQTTEFDKIETPDWHKDLEVLAKAWSSPLEPVFEEMHTEKIKPKSYHFETDRCAIANVIVTKPKVLIPAFPGTNCEWDTQKAFEYAGADVVPFVFNNLSQKDVEKSLLTLTKLIEEVQMIALPGGFSAGDEPDGSGKFIASVFRNPQVAEAVMKLLDDRGGLMLGICNGFQALIKLGLLPYGEIKTLTDDAPTLTFNKIGRHVSKMAHVRVASNLSPWLSNTSVGEVYTTAFSHGEGRFFMNEYHSFEYSIKGQIATQYVDLDHHVARDGQFNINGSVDAIEGISSPDGRILGKMGHVERIGKGLYKNIYGETDMKLFQSGVAFFKS